MFGGEDMLRRVPWGRIRWAGIVVGVAATMLFMYLLLYLVVFSVIMPYLYRTFIAEGPGVSAREDALFNTLSTGSLLIAVLLAFLLGGIPVGWVVGAFPGFNGALSTAVTAFGGLALFAVPILPWIWEPISNPGEAATRSENLYNLLEVGVMFCLVLPFIVLAGYLGGKLGRILRNRLTTA